MARAKSKQSSNHEERAHAPLPPSASKRWLACSPSQGYIFRLIDMGQITKRQSGPAAQRGTRIHEIAEPWLRASIAEKKFKVSTKFKPKGAKDEIAEARAYVEYCLRKWEEACDVDPKATCGVEHRSNVTEECWGSCDFWIFAGKRFTSIDLKSGREAVIPKGNTQLLIYALGVIMANKFVVRDVELSIWQPNADSEKPEQVHIYERAEFTDLVSRIRAGIKEATRYLDPTIQDLPSYEARLQAGDHCDWCDALGVCPEARRRQLAISSKSFEPVALDKFDPPSPIKLEADQVAEIMRRAPVFMSWLSAVELRAMELIQKGHRVPGYKVVPKQTRRAWEGKYTDAQIAKGLGLNVKEIVETKRLSPSKVEEQLDKARKEKLKKFVFKPIGEPTVVAESDRRQALPSTKISFTAVSREEEDDG